MSVRALFARINANFPLFMSRVILIKTKHYTTEKVSIDPKFISSCAGNRGKSRLLSLKNSFGVSVGRLISCNGSQFRVHSLMGERLNHS